MTFDEIISHIRENKIYQWWTLFQSFLWDAVVTDVPTHWKWLPCLAAALCISISIGYWFSIRFWNSELMRLANEELAFAA